MGVSGISAPAGYGRDSSANYTPRVGNTDGERLAAALREEQDSQPSLSEMMKEARQRADERDRFLKKTKNTRYGDAPIQAYARLARAKSLGEVDAASGYARRQIARLRAAKSGDAENAGRIQAAINQLQKAVNRAGRKKRELTQEKTSAVRQAKLEQEKRTREAKRQRLELRRRQTARVMRESRYIQEAETDNRIQSQLSAAKLELRNQMQELTGAAQASLETAIQGYAASGGGEAQAASEISVEA